MPDRDWNEATTYGGTARVFWWRVDADGGLVLRRRVSGGSRRDEERALSRADLERLTAFMADEAWHPLAAGVKPVGTGAKPDGIGAFLHRVLGWSAQATTLASHLAVVLADAGLWEWDGRKKGMRFRQLHADLDRLAATVHPKKRKRPAAGRPKQQPPALDLAARYRAAAAALRAQLDETDSGGRHHVAKGERREAAVRRFLRDHLPSAYGVTHGEIVRATGDASRQVDVLIYDEPHAPKLLGGRGAPRLLAAESVYAAIEVKPRLTATELRNAVANIESVKLLSRRAILRPGLRGPDENPPIWGAIFAFDGIDRRQIAATLHQAQADVPPACWVDCVCVLDAAVLHRYVEALPGMPPTASNVPMPYVAVPAGRDSLLLFTLHLLRDLSAKALQPPDLLCYTLGLDLPPGEFL